MEDLGGRIALVTGASRGIGAAAALALAKEGADVAVNFRVNRKEAEEVCTAIKNMGRRAIAVAADVSVSADAESLVNSVEEKLGGVDILVNNAGITRRQPFDEITEKDWDEVPAINLKSVFLVTRLVLPHMRTQRWGRIINLSSVAAQTGGVIGPHYAASKAGIIGITHSYASLLAKEGITVNAVAPALIRTDMIAGNPKATPALIPVGRFGEVDEVSDIVVMLAKNGYMTGQTINPNGGWYMS